MGLWTGAGFVNPSEYGKPFSKTKAKVYCKDCKYFKATGTMSWHRFLHEYRDCGFIQCLHPENTKEETKIKHTFYEQIEYKVYVNYLRPETRNKDNDCPLFAPTKEGAWEV